MSQEMRRRRLERLAAERLKNEEGKQGAEVPSSAVAPARRRAPTPTPVVDDEVEKLISDETAAKLKAAGALAAKLGRKSLEKTKEAAVAATEKAKGARADIQAKQEARVQVQEGEGAKTAPSQGNKRVALAVGVSLLLIGAGGAAWWFTSQGKGEESAGANEVVADPAPAPMMAPPAYPNAVPVQPAPAVVLDEAPIAPEPAPSEGSPEVEQEPEPVFSPMIRPNYGAAPSEPKTEVVEPEPKPVAEVVAPTPTPKPVVATPVAKPKAPAPKSVLAPVVQPKPVPGAVPQRIEVPSTPRPSAPIPKPVPERDGWQDKANEEIDAWAEALGG